MTADRLARLLLADPVRWRLLGAVRALGLPDCWVGAGFVRDAVWDDLHGRPATPPRGDVDVAWFGPAGTRADDEALEARLAQAEPGIAWSVKNQARMHARNDDPPYRSTEHALRHWPETVTAVAVRRTAQDGMAVCAPFGLDDLSALHLRPTPHFAGTRLPVCAERARRKGWFTRWPGLAWAPGTTPPP